MAKHIHIHIPKKKSRDAYRGEYTKEVEESRFNSLIVGKESKDGDQKVVVVKKEKKAATKTSNGTMIPEKFLVTFKTVDAGFTKYDPREVARLKQELERLEARYSTSTPLREKAATAERIKEIKKELSKYHDSASAVAKVQKEIEAQERLISAMEKNGKGDKAGPLRQRLKFLQEELEKAKVDDGFVGISGRVGLEADSKDARLDADLKKLEDEADRLEKEIDRKDDQGLTVRPEDRKRLVELHKQIHQLTQEKTKDAIKPYVSSDRDGWVVLNSEEKEVKRFPKTPAGRDQAQQYMRSHWDELSGKSSAKDARETKFGLPVYTEEEVNRKLRNGEWECETDLAKGKRVEIRQGKKRFQIYVAD